MTEPEMTNDQYHDLLDAVKAAEQDFRYVNIDDGGTRFEVEAYQININSLATPKEWPIWMVMQKTPEQLNAIYRDSDAPAPDNLVLMMADGTHQPLGATDWLVLYKTGDIAVVPKGGFGHFEKVVPVPEKPKPPESLPGFEEQFEVDENNKLVKRTTPLVKDEPVPGIDDLEDQVGSVDDGMTDNEGLVGIMVEVLDLLQSENPDDATDLLKVDLLQRVFWCNCTPGKCLGGEPSQRLGCRQHSPLLK